MRGGDDEHVSGGDEEERDVRLTPSLCAYIEVVYTYLFPILVNPLITTLMVDPPVDMLL